jgi:RHS repeat-associated protein
VEQVAGSGLLNTFVYDQENRLLNEIRVSGARHTYTYEPEGLRRSAFHAGTSDVVTFIWDGDDLLNERIEGANAARYAVLDGEVLSEKRGASRYRFVPDPLGSVRAVLDTSGSIVATRDYWPYGEVAAQSGGMTAIQFVGALGYFTDTTNRVYVRARHYRPDLGRWVTEDPIGFAGGDWNVYRYAGGSPSNKADPSGTISSAWCLLLCIGAGPLYGICLDACTTAVDMCEFQKQWRRIRRNWEKCKHPSQMSDCWNCPGRRSSSFYLDKCMTCCAGAPGETAECQEGCESRHHGGAARHGYRSPGLGAPVDATFQRLREGAAR